MLQKATEYMISCIWNVQHMQVCQTNARFDKVVEMNNLGTDVQLWGITIYSSFDWGVKENILKLVLGDGLCKFLIYQKPMKKCQRVIFKWHLIEYKSLGFFFSKRNL